MSTPRLTISVLDTVKSYYPIVNIVGLLFDRFFLLLIASSRTNRVVSWTLIGLGQIQAIRLASSAIMGMPRLNLHGRPWQSHSNYILRNSDNFNKSVKFIADIMNKGGMCSQRQHL